MSSQLNVFITFMSMTHFELNGMGKWCMGKRVYLYLMSSWSSGSTQCEGWEKTNVVGVFGSLVTLFLVDYFNLSFWCCICKSPVKWHLTFEWHFLVSDLIMKRFPFFPSNLCSHRSPNQPQYIWICIIKGELWHLLFKSSFIHLCTFASLRSLPSQPPAGSLW